ncbi:MAG: NADPH:quinone oxidoreductase family protein [Acidimicrobiia bacterium]|nr:NADPH:quinone oxidoreductase family protein [Acidimicrobiia bacterium]
MRAAVCVRVGDDAGVELGELPDPVAGPGQVEIAVAAAGVNFPDLLMVRGLYQFRPEPPFAPGVEVAGTVAASADAGFAPGLPVMAYVSHGGWAERVVVDAAQVFPIPAAMLFEVAAVIPVGYGTAIHALVDRARIQPGETLVVLGAAGGVGLASVQLGRILGARVIAVVSAEDKAAAAAAAGAEAVVRYDREDLRDRLGALAPDGVDVVFDPVGGDVTEVAFRSLGWGGRLLVIGFTSGSIASLPANLPLLKGSAMVGVFWGRFAELEPDANRAHMETLGGWWSDGSIDPHISGRYRLDEAAEALHRVAGRQVIGKLVVVP